MAFTATNQVRINSRFTDTDGIGTASQPVEKTYVTSLSEGTASGQADLQYADTATIAGGANLDIDLTSVQNAFGDALGAVNVVQILIASDAANTTNLTTGGSSADFTGLPAHTIAPGGIVNIANGAGGIGSVVNGSDDTIRISNAAGADASVDIYIVARSA